MRLFWRRIQKQYGVLWTRPGWGLYHDHEKNSLYRRRIALTHFEQTKLIVKPRLKTLQSLLCRSTFGQSVWHPAYEYTPWLYTRTIMQYAPENNR